MTEWFGFYFPDELTILEMHNVARVSSEKGVYEYEITDGANVMLKLSFNIFEKYFQITLSVNGKVVQSVSQDGLWTLSPLISGNIKGLRAEANHEKSFTTVDIFWEPNILVSWRTTAI